MVTHLPGVPAAPLIKHLQPGKVSTFSFPASLAPATSTKRTWEISGVGSPGFVEHVACPSLWWSCSREVRIRVPFFLQSILVDYNPPNQKGVKERAPSWGTQDLGSNGSNHKFKRPGAPALGSLASFTCLASSSLSAARPNRRTRLQTRGTRLSRGARLSSQVEGTSLAGASGDMQGMNLKQQKTENI